jgi:organic radical activating enzyme
MLQQEAWAEVMRLLRTQNEAYWFEVETNGSRTPEPPFDALVDQYNVSPKMSNSKNPRSLREQDDALRFFAGDSKAIFKYVAAEPGDLDEIEGQVQHFRIPRQRVYLMPEGRSSEQLRRRSSWLVDECLRLGFHFSDRMHIHLFQDARGH